MKTTAFLNSSIGKKYLMAISGLIWAGFIFGHMAGNMLMFVSKDAYNSYGHALTSGVLIYIVEAALIGSILAHVIHGTGLAIKNYMARGNHRYASSGSRKKAANFGSSTMIFQGTLILFFIISHLLTFKYGQYYEVTVGGVVMRDLFRLVVEIFHEPGFLAWYGISLVVLGIHLSHGIGSTIQSLGVFANRDDRRLKTISWIYGVVVAGGFLSQPIYIYFFAS